MYPGKIILFGEYTVLVGSDALAIPFQRFKGELIIPETNQETYDPKIHFSNNNIRELAGYLKIHPSFQSSGSFLNLEQLERDLNKGLYFKSDIPEKAGLGSSGALVAAVFDRYKTKFHSDAAIDEIRKLLAIPESFFHGTSSGIDPLVSYLNTPIHLQNSLITKESEFPINELLKKLGFFLFSSGRSSKTLNLVEYFKKKYDDDTGYYSLINEEYIPLINYVINILVSGVETTGLHALIHRIARLQTDLFSEMIPESLLTVINYGIDSKLFSIKLCGSGGGGYFLGFTDNINKTDSYFRDNGLEILKY